MAYFDGAAGETVHYKYNQTTIKTASVEKNKT